MFPKSENAPLLRQLVGCELVDEAGVRSGNVSLLHDRVLSVTAKEHIDGLVGVPTEQIDCSGSIVMPALIDGHCHPLGGGGGGGPQEQNLPIPLEDFFIAGVGGIIGVLGHDTLVRTPESLLVRTNALRNMGLPAYSLAGEIASPIRTVAGGLERDVALIDSIVGVKVSLGESVSLRDLDDLLDRYSQLVRGSRTGGKPPQLHIHLSANPDCLVPVEQAVAGNYVDPSHITITHVNWNEQVLERSGKLMMLGVFVDVTACIRPDYFPQSVSPAAAVSQLLQLDPEGRRISVSSDAGGSHKVGNSLIDHKPALLLEVVRQMIQNNSTSFHILSRVFCANIISRHGLNLPTTVTPRGKANLVIIPKNVKESISLIINGELVVDRGERLFLDPVATSNSQPKIS